MPGNKVFDDVIFEGPDVLAEFGGVSASCFEVILCASNVHFCHVVFACYKALLCNNYG